MTVLDDLMMPHWTNLSDGFSYFDPQDAAFDSKESEKCTSFLS